MVHEIKLHTHKNKKSKKMKGSRKVEEMIDCRKG
jgi:hypothetical protein